uniref:Uncharacterized protein n=1 Tax=Anopheles maculatus TaxID=74869 RepID=A0A182SP57_9DIPT
MVNDNKDVNNQQQPSSIAEAISLSESNSHCLTLRDRRSNSYSAVLESSENQPPERMAMSIQTYFMTFNEQQDDNVKSVRVEEESLSTNITESVPWTVATEVEIETNSTPNDDDTIKVSNKPKVSTAEAVRERLRKRINANVQKAPPGSEISATATISPKRRLSIDSVASIVGKRQKLETAVLIDETKRSGVPPSPKLSSTYFSQIALPITSALDSIPSKLKSPNVKHGAWDSMLKTPMVVVHSPAKPSQQTSENVPIYYPSCPADSSSLQNIMHSLFDTPIKNEVPDRVSPPCEDDNQQISTANYDNIVQQIICLASQHVNVKSRGFLLHDRTSNFKMAY